MYKPLPSFNAFNDHYIGKINAPVEIIVYGDFGCQHCGALYSVIKFLQEVLGAQLRYVFRHFPLQNLHILALDAAVATEVASLQNKFWQMHDLIFMNQKYLTRATISDFMEDLELDTNYFNANCEFKKVARKVLIDVERSIESGVDETPSLFINGVKYHGLCDFKSLYKTCIDLHKGESEMTLPEQEVMGWLVS